MSFDEKIFGWAYNKLNGNRPQKKQLQSDWDSRTKHIQLVGSSLIGLSLEIKTSTQLLFSKINRIYFPPLESFPIDLAEAFLWLKVLFHTAALKTGTFWPSDSDQFLENTVRSSAEWDRIIFSAGVNFPRIKERTEELETQISKTNLNHSKIWDHFRSCAVPKTLESKMQIALPSLPLKMHHFTKSKSIASPNREMSKMANPQLNKPVNLAAEAEIEDVVLSENGENPLVHVFEKVLTAENYKGGARREDGSDEMEDHSNALKDLKVDKLTRSSEETHGQISTDLEIESTGDLADGEDDPGFSLSYPEWFESEQKFRADWCRLKESTPHSSQTEVMVANAILVDTNLIALQLKSDLETVFHRAEWKNRQREGSDIDLDAIVRYRSDPKEFSSGANRAFIRREKLIQDFALLLVVDISASTDAWVANRRVLDELRAVLSILSFVFDGCPEKIGISSFSSDSRLRCSYNWIKHFHEGWGPSLARITFMEPRGYTRMGVALRHSEKRLLEVPARRRAILLLTDAKPTDFDRYEGKHGRADVRKSIEELEASDIRFLSLAFSEKRDRSFSDLFGNNRCEVVQTADQIGRSFVDEFVALIRT